jgi:putative ABC transport system substrate-binding protein
MGMAAMQAPGRRAVLRAVLVSPLLASPLLASPLLAGVAALFVVSDVSTISNRVRLGEVAVAHRMPMMLSNRRCLTGGGLMSYGPDISEGFRRAARQVVRAANGTPVSRLPVENPTHFEPVIDLRAAQALQAEIAPAVLDRADEVIE